MIVLNLACASGHHFDGWFASSEAFNLQLKQALINCPHCESTAISRLPCGPHVAKSRATDVVAAAGDLNVVEAVMDLLQRISETSEDVGDQFPEEARRIHRLESSARSIKGRANLDEVQDLLDEGIAVLPISVKKTNH